jgi:hypothetical protein
MSAPPPWFPPCRSEPPDLDPYRVRVSDPGELAAAVPQLLGFRPRESVVLIGLGGVRGNQVGLTVRGDIPPPGSEPALARALSRSVGTGGPEAVVVALVSEAPDYPDGVAGGPDLPHRGLLRDLTIALALDGIAVRTSLLIRGGRWWSYECSEACCRPGAGTALPAGVTALEAASVASGVVVENGREALERRLAPDPGRADTAGACRRLADARGSATGDVRGPADDWTAILEALRRCAPGAPPGAARLPDELVARVVWALRHEPTIRDRALVLALGDDASAAEALWIQCTRRAPQPLDAAPATLVAVCAWLRGDGAMANVALERALCSDPGNRLARLLAPALDACLHPAELRRLIAESARTGPDR